MSEQKIAIVGSGLIVLGIVLGIVRSIVLAIIGE